MDVPPCSPTNYTPIHPMPPSPPSCLFIKRRFFSSAFALQQSFVLSSSNPFLKYQKNVSKVMTAVNNVIRLDKHQPIYNLWGKGEIKRCLCFICITIYQTHNIHKLFSENDYRAFDTAEILVELKRMSLFACKKVFVKLTKVRTAYMRFSNIGNIQKEEKKHLIKN